MHTTSVSLLDRLRTRPDDQTWGRFVDLYAPLLHYWSRKTGMNEQDAADLVQDVFVTLVQKMREFRYDQAKGFRSWLRTVIMNKWRDRCRVIAQRPTAGAAGLSGVSSSDNVERFWEEEHQQHLFRRALEMMQAEFEPATWKACWAMVVDGQAPRDVARLLGVTENAVYLAKFRVTRKLRQEFAGLLD